MSKILTDELYNTPTYMSSKKKKLNASQLRVKACH